MRPLGFIGLGQIGAPMATHLLARPEGLVVCDIRAEATEPFATQGATVAATPADVGAVAGLISVMVLDDAQVRAVVGEILTTASPGTIVAIHSTIRPETAEALAATAATSGIDVIDAPVSGGFLGAHQGELAVMVGGDRRAYEACKEPFSAWAGLVMHFGPAGAGTRAKLARNLLHFIAFTAAGESQALAEAAGIDLGKLARVVRHSDSIVGGPGTIMVRSTTGPLEPGDEWYDVMLHTRSLGEKDLRLALELARSLEIELPLGRVALRRFGTSLGLTPGDPP